MTRPPRRRRAHGGGRSLLICATFVTALAVIGGRIWYLQAIAAGRFIVRWDHLETELEPIPARDGRVLSADGLALAYDRTRFDVAIHYRWLEDPPDARWLRDEARSRLTPKERRDRTRLAQAEAGVLQVRSEFWRSLESLAGISDSDCGTSRRRIQDRVERIAASVERRRLQKAANQGDVRSTDANSFSSAPIWVRGWKALLTELTTPPARDAPEPLIVKEELAYHEFLKDVSFEVAAQIESGPATFPPEAVRVSIGSERVYPAGSLASHIVGVRRADPDGAAEDPGVRRRRGRTGIEQSYGPLLDGQEGVRRVIYNRRREVVETTVIRPPVDGRDVTLTFDSTLQRAAETILDAALREESAEQETDREAPEHTTVDPLPTGATLVAIDVSTGELLAAAAAPRIDLSLYSAFEKDRWDEALRDPRHPFYPRITALTAPPGSVFKVLTAIAALESGVVEPETVLHCQGYLDRPDQLRCMIFRRQGVGHGDMTISDALCQSCNVYFFQAARRMGPEPLRVWSTRFGFGAATGVDMPGEAAGHVPATMGSGRSATSTAMQLAIGQSSLLVSPLQVVRMMAAVANGGRLVTPRLVRPPTPQDAADDAVRLASYSRLESSSDQRVPGLSPRTLAVLRESLERVVSDPHGTGKTARVAGIRIAGKTGTAETGRGRPDHAWFAGYVPADRPRIAFVVMLEHAGSGGHSAGPVARRFVEALVDQGLIRSAEPSGHPRPSGGPRPATAGPADFRPPADEVRPRREAQ